MTPEISEFSYGFALTNEVVGWVNPKAAPIFPSLIEEGRAGGGYDVKLDMPAVPLYLQFKRADCMTRRSAWEISRENARLNVPFYRFAITRSGQSHQHAFLLELDDGTNEVFYAAPRFHELAEINQAWSAKEVAARSIFVRPATIGPLDNESHHVAYDEYRAYLCSKPRPVEFVTASRLADKLAAHLAAENRPLREALPEFNTSLINAWARGKERVTKLLEEQALEGVFQVPTLPGPLVLPSHALPDVSTRVVPIRESSPLPEGSAPLRELADNALKLFDAQLVVIQNAN